MIPKIIHQIWIGPNEPSELFTKCMASVVDKNPDYEYILHDNETLKKYDLDKYLGLTPESFISDILRWKVLSEYGGYYVDADMLAKQSLNELPEEVRTSELSSLYMSNHSTTFPTTGMFVMRPGYDVSELVNVFIPYKSPMLLWRGWLDNREHFKIPKELCSVDGSILVDNLASTWGEAAMLLREADKKVITDLFYRIS